MGILDFLKKKPEQTSVPPPPSVPPGVAPITKNDEKLSSQMPLLPPKAPEVKTVSFPPPPNPVSKLPPLPPPNMVNTERKELPLPQKLPPLQEIKAPTAPQPKPSTPIFETPKVLPPLNSPMDKKPFAIHESPPETKLKVPQVTQPIQSKVPEIKKEEKSQVPVQELRKVIEELRNIPLNIPQNEIKKKEVVKEEPVVKFDAKKDAYIPLADFDDTIIQIRAAHQSINSIQHGNERAGALEGQLKNTIDALSVDCESIHSSLMKIDETLFQVKGNG